MNSQVPVMPNSYKPNGYDVSDDGATTASGQGRFHTDTDFPPPPPSALTHSAPTPAPRRSGTFSNAAHARSSVLPGHAGITSRTPGMREQPCLSYRRPPPVPPKVPRPVSDAVLGDGNRCPSLPLPNRARPPLPIRVLGRPGVPPPPVPTVSRSTKGPAPRPPPGSSQTSSRNSVLERCGNEFVSELEKVYRFPTDSPPTKPFRPILTPRSYPRQNPTNTVNARTEGIAPDRYTCILDYPFHNADADSSNDEKSLQPLEGHVWRSKEKCCVTDDDDWREWRAKLACGHAVSVEAVHRMLDITVQDGRYEFHCPSCSFPLEWFVVRHILSTAMTENELQKSLETINNNYLKRKPDIRRCISCGTFQQRDFTKTWNTESDRVVCNECTRRAGHEVSFCWHCRQPWRSGFKGCGNRKCDGEAAKLNELQECKRKKIGSVAGCPSVRACPKCATLKYHIDLCKHMSCRCGCNFCFVCLSLQNLDGTWPCGSSSDTCSVASRQTSLPNS